MHRLVLIFFATLLAAQTPANYAGLRWRDIGPYRGGRTVGAAGIAAQPNVFYIGVNNGGVWKTDDFGRTWKPLFDDQPTGSIGAIAIAPSDPNIIYVGSGEGLQRPDLSVGDGMYKSTDAGKTWTPPRPPRRPADPRHHRRPAQSQPPLRRRPRPPLRPQPRARRLPLHRWRPVLAEGALQGRPHRRHRSRLRPAQSADRLRRPLAGAAGPLGKRRLLRPQQRPLQIHRRRHHLESASAPACPPSHQGGLGRIGIAIAPSDGNRMYALVEARGEAGGSIAPTTPAPPGSASTASSASTAAAAISPASASTPRTRTSSTSPTPPPTAPPMPARVSPPSRARPAATTITPSGSIPRTPTSSSSPPTRAPPSPSTTAPPGAVGTTSRPRSSITSSPTIRFPTGSTAASRRAAPPASPAAATMAQITFRDWHPVGAEEYGYIAPDPLNPNIIYGSHGTQLQLASPAKSSNVASARQLSLSAHRAAALQHRRSARALPRRAGRPQDHRWRRNWEAISPDLSRETYDLPASVAVLSRRRQTAGHPPRRGLLARALAPQRQRPLGRHRRWPHPRHARRRQDLEERHPARPDPVEQDRAARCLPLRRQHRLRRRQPPPPRRPEAAHLSHPRWRRHLAGDRPRPARCPRQRRPRRSRAQRPALRRHRARRLRQLQRWRRLAAPAPEHARHLDPRPRGAR